MDTMKTRLFANISHEFRTPLTLIKGPIEKLEQQQKTMISMPNIKMIRRSANRLLNLVNQLLDLSKLDSGKLGLNEAEGDVFRCIRAAASAFSSHAASRNMDYQIRVPSDLLWASFDRDKMEKVIYNLLSNAFKFTEDKGQVILLAEFRSHRLHLKVSDTGSGIAREKLSHIFDRFFQVDDSYTREKTGSGIGLALTKELVELMGGTIYVESELGKGTIFKVVLPMEEIRSYKRKEPEELSITPFDDEDYVPKTKVSEADGENTKVLVIEDNNDMRHFIREQLEPQYAVLEAINGKEGLKRANKIVPDLIITDLMMPRMDGITLCKKLKSNLATSHIPVIMLTAKAGIENKLEGLETGADDYLTKPFNAKELFIRTKNLIEQRKQLRELFSRNISLDPKEITVTSLDEKFLRQVISLLEENYSNSRFGLPQMQKAMALSRTQLHYKLKALTNYPPGELLRNFRLKRAAQLLSQKADNISQIAYDVGFNSASYFTRCFKELYGMSPTAYQQKNT
jgi:DNA-binding response OmpR family regulator